MNYILFDGPQRKALLPFTYTRPVAEIRIGILTIKEKWEEYLGNTVTVFTEKYLEEKYSIIEKEQNILINACVLPTPDLVKEIKTLSENEILVNKDTTIAFYSKDVRQKVNFERCKSVQYEGVFFIIESLYDIFSKNYLALKADFKMLTKGKISQTISKTNNVSGIKNIFIEKGVEVEFANLNADKGPIYIAKNSLIMEGSMIRGPFYLGEKSIVKMGAKIYGATTIGPRCTVGGEIKNSVFLGNSNKAHDGYIGDSVIGEWCNLGANTNCSNMKNNHNEVTLWNYKTKKIENTGNQFCGLLLGDHCKTSINTIFNTGTVVGVSCNIFGVGFPKKYIPSFSWGTQTNKTFDLAKSKETAKKMYQLKNEEFTSIDEQIFDFLFENK